MPIGGHGSVIHCFCWRRLSIDPQRFHGGVYRAANWMELGVTQGYRRTKEGYGAEAVAPKRVFVRPLRRDARTQLTHPDRDQLHLTGAPKIMLNAEQMRQLPQCFKTIPDPRRSQGRRHRPPVARRALPCAACAATKPSPIGPVPWGSKPANVLIAGGRTDAMSCPANM